MEYFVQTVSAQIFHFIHDMINMTKNYFNHDCSGAEKIVHIFSVNHGSTSSWISAGWIRFVQVVAHCPWTVLFTMKSIKIINSFWRPYGVDGALEILEIQTVRAFISLATQDIAISSLNILVTSSKASTVQPYRSVLIVQGRLCLYFKLKLYTTSA